jgi:solute:Na+ symporter, SSS family
MNLASRVDLVVVVIYLLLMVLVGVALSFFNRDESDFFRSGNKMPWWLAGFSLFMSSFSVWTFTGAAGLAYRAPGAAFAMYFSTAIGMVFGVWFLARLWRRTRASTILSYLTERFNLATNQTYSWTMMPLQLLQGGIQLLALGTFISVALGTDLRLTVIVCGAIIALYCLIGGLWAVVVTDTLQFMVLFPTALVVMFLGIRETGGLRSIVTDVPEGFWSVNTGEYSWWYILAFGVMMVFAMNAGAMAQRYFSVKNEREARKVAVLAMVLFFLAPFLWFLPPLFARLNGLDLASITLGLSAPEEAAYVAYCLHILPHGAIGILLAAMLSATMSSLSSVFNAYSAVITDDIIKQIFWKEASGRKLLLIGRLATLAFGAMVVGAALMQANGDVGVFQLMMTFSGIVIMPTGIPIVLGLFYHRTPPWAAIASYLSGVLMGTGMLLLDVELSFTSQVFITGGVSMAVFILPGVFFHPSPDYARRLASFYAKMKTPVTSFEIGDTRITDTGSFRITGWTAVIMGVGAASLGLLDLGFEDRMINLLIGMAIGSSGAILLVAERLATHKLAFAASAKTEEKSNDL